MVTFRRTGKPILEHVKTPVRNASTLIDYSSFLKGNAPVTKWVRMGMADVPIFDEIRFLQSNSQFRHYLYEENMSCVIPMYKPMGINSQSFIMDFKTKFGLTKELRVGHGGCLDPNAHGILMLGVNGQGTKALKYLDRDEKVYDFVIQCGSSTPSYDADTVKFATHCPHYRYFFDRNCQSVEQVNELVTQYLKERNNVLVQKTPVFSAVKIGGKRLFSHGYSKLRRMEEQNEEERKYAGLYCEEESLSLPSRSIRVDKIECTHIDRELGRLSFSCTCSTGTYVRILGYEISHLLEVCGAYVTDLHRTRIGKNVTMLKLEDIGNLQ